MSAQISLKVEPKPSGLEQIATAAGDLAEQENWSPDLMFWVDLVLEELTVNIVNYGGEVNEIEVSLSSDSDTVTIEITDDGSPFDPLKNAPDPKVDAPLDERPVGKLGIYLVRTVMDEMHYRREDGKNYLFMTKRREE